MRRVLISGYLGYGNFGDEALLHVLIKNLTQTGFRNQEIFVITASPEYTRQLFKVNIVNRWNFLEVVTACFECDCIIFLGGLFQDRTSFKSFLYYYIQLFITNFLKKEVVFYGSGIGPFRKKLSRDLFNAEIKNVSLITVRDETSSRETSFNLPITCDPVWEIEPDFTFQYELIKVNWKLPILGVSIRNDKFLKRNHLVILADKLSRIVANTQDWQLVFIPCMPEDIPIMNELERLVTKKANHPGRVLFINNFSNFTIPQQAGILASCDVMVGMRYHSLLVPIACGKPVFGLVYDQKVGSLLEFSEQVGVTFKDDLDKPWDYFWQNLERSTALSKQAQEKAHHLNERNNELIQALAMRIKQK